MYFLYGPSSPDLIHRDRWNEFKGRLAEAKAVGQHQVDRGGPMGFAFLD